MKPIIALVAVVTCCAIAQAELVLQSDRLEAVVSEETGTLMSLTDRQHGLPLLSASPDRYALQPDPKNEVVATELEDQVTSRVGDVLVCRNPRLPGVRIEKQYTLDGRMVTKRVRFSTQAHDVGLLKYSVSSTVPGEFYAGGYLNDPSRHPVDYPYVFTRDLTQERHIPDYGAAADHHCVIFANPERGMGLAQYRLSVDGRFVHPLTGYSYEPGLYYGPDGWRVAVAAKWLSDDRPDLQCETRWHLFEGDHIAFHQEYMALPEFVAEWDWKSPEWLREVIGIHSWQWPDSGLNVARIGELVESFSEGNLLVTLGGIFHNTRDYLSDPIQTPSGVPLPAAELRRIVDDLHALSPRIKVGPVTWQWGFGEMDPVFHSHPEWTVHDALGLPVFACSGWSDERVYSQLLTPQCRQFVTSQFAGACSRYDFDFIYMDSGQGGVTRFDWNTHWGAQDYDWADLYRGIRDATRANRNGATFFNGTPRLYSSYCDLGYFEGVGFIKVRDWRAMADRLVLVKLYQPGEKLTMPLYWRDENLDEYYAQCLSLALKPAHFIGFSTASRRWPAAAAANELTAARYVPEAEARPCWWREQTEVEAYALRLPGGGLLTALSHEPQATQAELSCRLEPLGLDPARPVHLWAFAMASVTEMIAEVRITEAQANEWYAQSGQAAHRGVSARYLGTQSFGDGTARVSLQLQPGVTELVLLTQADELAIERDGRPTHFLLPAGPDATKTVPAGQALAPELVASRESPRLPEGWASQVLTPASSSPAIMNQAVEEIGREVAGLRVARLLTNDCEHNSQDTSSASVDGGTISLHAEMGREKLAGYAYAGVEAGNAGTLSLRVKLGEPLYGRFRPQNGGCFAGLVVDYAVAGTWVQRVRFALGPVGELALKSPRPWVGLFEADETVANAKWVDLQAETEPGQERELTLDLGRYAPEGWGGQVLFGVYLESCGFDVKLDAQVLGNGPAGERDPQAFSPPPHPPARGTVVGVFQDANIYRLEDGAELRGESVFFPSNGAIEADGVRVSKWRVVREPGSKVALLLVNYQRPGGVYELHQYDFGAKVGPGATGEVEFDLGELAPADWNGRVRIRLRGDGITAELISAARTQWF